MNTFSNFGSFNGRIMPGSGWGGFGGCGWGGSCCTDMSFLDCDGNVWAPCVCRENGGEEGEGGDEEGEGAAGSGGIEIIGDAEEITRIQGRLQYIPNRNGAFVQVNYPEAILHYDGQTFTLDGRQYNKGMLADTDRGHRYAYRGAHTGRVRLHIAQTNRTTAKAVMEGGGIVLLDGVYPGVPLYYAICFAAAKEGATVTVMRQGASIGARGNNAALKEYLRFAQQAQTFAIPPGKAKWLFLGRQGVPSTPRAEVPCRFIENFDQRERIGTGPHLSSIEAQLDIEIIGEATLICCAFHDFGKVDLNGSMFPLPMPQETPRDETPIGGLTGVRHRFWGFEGMFSWELDDNSNAAGIALEALEEPEPMEVLASRDPWPLGEHNLDQILFYPPIVPAAREMRGAPRGDAANRGVVYHQVFVLRNNGELPRRVNHYVEGGKGGEILLALSHGQVISYEAEAAPQMVAAVPRIEPHGKKITESWHVCGAGTELRHILRSDEAA